MDDQIRFALQQFVIKMDPLPDVWKQISARAKRWMFIKRIGSLLSLKSHRKEEGDLNLDDEIYR
jgi:hypothetical protein